MRITLRWFVAGLVLGLLSSWAGSSLWRSSQAQPTTVTPERTAEYLHAVIEAVRTNYAESIVNRLQDQDIIHATEHWKQEKGLPLPAQFLMDNGRLVAQKDLQLSYRLASLTPIYVWNGPNSDLERKGLEAIAKNPDRPFTGYVRTAKGRFLKAVYADRAVSQSCVSCHNTHPNSPRRDFKLNDVMGGLIISIPLED
ncbi:MAG: DUF3365 domain-containing protein [Nitrospiraceae bacterium]